MVIKATMERKTEGSTGKSIKTILETGVKSDVAFCLGPSIEKTNSDEVKERELMALPETAKIKLPNEGSLQLLSPLDSFLPATSLVVFV